MLKKLLCATFALLFTSSVAMADTTFYDLKATTIDGSSQSMSEYKGKVLLVVNVASRCGFTPQYAGLEELYESLKDRGFVVLGFPSNDFGEQEPGSDADIKAFCTNKFGVSFPMFSKVRVVGQERMPLYDYLVRSTGGSEVGWNFEKFLIDRSGQVVGRFESNVRPSDPALRAAIEKALG